METFKIRKNGNASSYLGTVSTNSALMSYADLKLIKFTSFSFMTIMMYFFTSVPQNIAFF
jgi:hypothetical protein